MNKWDEMRIAVADARTVLNAADRVVPEMAGMIAGRLRKAGVHRHILRQLKAELRRYNPHTDTWRD